MIDYTATIPKTYCYILDINENVVALADEMGNRLVNYEYDAWGSLANTPEGVTTGNGEYLRNANPFRYSSYQFDSESGLYYLKARYYTTTIGRFLSRDILYEIKSKSFSINEYIYAYNNPVNYSDPDGHKEWPKWVKWLKLAASWAAFGFSIASLIVSSATLASTLATIGLAISVAILAASVIEALVVRKYSIKSKQFWSFVWADALGVVTGGAAKVFRGASALGHIDVLISMSVGRVMLYYDTIKTSVDALQEKNKKKNEKKNKRRNYDFRYA